MYKPLPAISVTGFALQSSQVPARQFGDQVSAAIKYYQPITWTFTLIVDKFVAKTVYLLHTFFPLLHYLRSYRFENDILQ